MPDGAFPASAVETREDLTEYLSQSLLDEYFERVGGRITRQVSTSLKTYLIELHLPDGSPAPVLTGSAFARLEPTHEPTLWRAYDKNNNAYFLDLLTDRFPLIHTIAHTNRTDPTLDRLVKDVRGADRCWLPSSFLLARSLGRVIGFRFFHQRVTSGLEDSEDAEELARDLGRPTPPAFRLSVSEYAHAEDDLRQLREQHLFGPRSALDSLAWRTRSQEPGGFIHDEVWSFGKITAYGNSWTSHLANVVAIRDRYAAVLRHLEESLAVRWHEDRLTGEPIELRFEGTSIERVPAFVDDLLEPSSPFRLWGVASNISETHVAADAVDLHTGHRLNLEISPQLIRVYLRTETCGNVLMRLISNLERYLSSEISTSVDGVLAS